MGKKAPVKKAAAKAPEKFESTRPKVHVPDPNNPRKAIEVGQEKPDMTGYKGSYHKIGEPKDAPPYGLKVVDDDEAANHFGRTHHARSTEFSWQGTAKEFKEQFE